MLYGLPGTSFTTFDVCLTNLFHSSSVPPPWDLSDKEEPLDCWCKIFAGRMTWTADDLDEDVAERYRLPRAVMDRRSRPGPEPTTLEAVGNQWRYTHS